MEYKHYQKIEGGSWAGVRLSTIEGLAKGFGVEAWELITPPSTNVRNSDRVIGKPALLPVKKT